MKQIAEPRDFTRGTTATAGKPAVQSQSKKISLRYSLCYQVCVKLSQNLYRQILMYTFICYRVRQQRILKKMFFFHTRLQVFKLLPYYITIIQFAIIKSFNSRAHVMCRYKMWRPNDVETSIGHHSVGHYAALSAFATIFYLLLFT